jgi:cell division protein FtsQ
MFKRMFNWGVWKYILISLAWVVSLGGIIVLMSFIAVKKAGVVCKDVKIFIPGNQYFIDKDQIDNILQLKSNTLIGRKLENINMHELENKLKANPFIEFARVYADMDGIICIDISQRQPMLRIMNQYEQDFYVDQHGLKLPLSENFTANVLVANGLIDEPFSGKVDTLHTALARDVFKTADFIRKNSLWSAQIAEIYVNQNHEIELIPRVGSQRILLGNADSLATRFHNLKVFYKQALPQVGWDAYKLINIKYANQVIGVRNDIMKKDSVKGAASDSTKLKKDTSLIKH